MNFKLNDAVYIKEIATKGVIKEVKDDIQEYLVTYFDKADEGKRKFETYTDNELDIWKVRKRRNRTLEIKIKFFDDYLPNIEKIEQGDWIDLRASEDIQLKQFEFKLIPLGVAMELPKGFEAHIAPRGSTFKNFGVIQTNSVGVVDESYCGDNDMLFMPVLAMRDTEIKKGDRVCQFRIVKKMPEISFKKVDILGNKDRNGHGSTGIK